MTDPADADAARRAALSPLLGADDVPSVVGVGSRHDRRALAPGRRAPAATKIITWWSGSGANRRRWPPA